VKNQARRSRARAARTVAYREMTGLRRLPGLDSRNHLGIRRGKIERRLQVHPELRSGAEVAAETQGGVRRHGRLLAGKALDPGARHMAGGGEGVAAKLERRHELLAQNLAGVDGGVRADHWAFPSVVIDDFNIFGIAVFPAEAHPELVVDPDAPLAATVALEGFQPVAGRGTEGVDGYGRIQHGELALGRADDIGREALRGLPLPHQFGRPALEALDHGLNVSPHDTNIKRNIQAGDRNEALD